MYVLLDPAGPETKKILTSDAVEQKFCLVKRRDMAEALCRYLDYNQNTYIDIGTTMHKYMQM